MGHPYSEHHEHTKSKSRVHHILRHEPSDMARHVDETAYSRINSKSEAVAHEHKASGHKAPKRYARGGKVGGHKGGHQTNIAIVMPHRSSPQPGGGAPAGGGGLPPAPPAPMMPMPPPGAGGPPGAGPPGAGMPPMRASGGRVKEIGGIANSANIKKWVARASANSYARGGAAKMTGGAATGVGRLEQFEAMKKKK